MYQIKWQPSASLEIIKKRAVLLQQIRNFMLSRDIMEVDTPILSHFGISDPYIQSMTTSSAAEKESLLYLHTSPEFCMKRLLAAGLGSIYQITHVFRNEESGKRHNTEFTMLEWYRTEFDYYQLMDEVTELLVSIGLTAPEKMTYAEAFMLTLQLDPHTVGSKQLQSLCQDNGWDADENDRHGLLDFIFSELVMKNIKNTKPLIIYDYPECMSALASLKAGDPVVSERFELFINNMEIANGFNELTDADEQLDRFEADLENRRNKGLAEPAIDKNFLAALQSGIPKCAGVAIGVERLLMVLSGKDDINAVSTFTLGSN
ncbi:MAG: elongation factor P--(R)-beta-lysine ligase [marine bacterium B5-7]|nr:MAG: elongation factor P--(R)-beta-lysine ligase [marine bacterium B5-7]